MDVAGAVVAQDVGTAGCALFNAGYFARYWWQRNGQRGRRIGAAALTLVSASAAVEAVFSQGLYWSSGAAAAPLPASVWALLRIPLFAATAFISLIILRRLFS